MLRNSNFLALFIDNSNYILNFANENRIKQVKNLQNRETNNSEAEGPTLTKQRNKTGADTTPAPFKNRKRDNKQNTNRGATLTTKRKVMNTTSNNTQSNNNANPITFVINYAAQLLKSGATVETMSKYGHVFYEIRKANEYVCVCSSDFIEAVKIANTNDSEPATMSEPAAVEPETQSSARRFASVVADYMAGTWDSIKTRSRKAWKKAAPTLSRFALRAFRVLWFVGILAACVFVMGATAAYLADCETFHQLPALVRIPAGCVAVFGGTLAVEFALLVISKRIDRATDHKLFAMH